MKELTTIISLDERGVAYIAGTRIKVSQIATENVRLGYSIQDIFVAHPHLTESQVKYALEYYHSNKSTVDAQIEAEEQYYKEFCERNPQTVTCEGLEKRQKSASSKYIARSDAATSSTLIIAEEGVEYN